MAREFDSTYFENRACAYYPCHAGADPDQFNCMFCYCPLYLLGRECGGNFTYSEAGIKDCSECLVPHGADGHDAIVSKLQELVFR